MIIVDRHHAPGGHWNDAYPFVRLHQPAAFYGVGSRPLGSDRIDEVGFNKGYCELPTGAEVLSHYASLMQERFLPSGRVRYFPMCDYLGDGRFRSLLSDEVHEVTVSKKLVDATWIKTEVPLDPSRRHSRSQTACNSSHPTCCRRLRPVTQTS